jgi:hypothetical protein
MEAIERRLRVMDSTALALCMDNGMPLCVFNMDDETNLTRIISGERVGTLVRSSPGNAAGTAEGVDEAATPVAATGAQARSDDGGAR